MLPCNLSLHGEHNTHKMRTMKMNLLKFCLPTGSNCRAVWKNTGCVDYCDASMQEARLMRWLSTKAPLAAVPRLQDYFVSKTHVCLVMNQLYQSLLDVIVQASSWRLGVLLENVRGIAIQLLVSCTCLCLPAVFKDCPPTLANTLYLPDRLLPSSTLPAIVLGKDMLNSGIVLNKSLASKGATVEWDVHTPVAYRLSHLIRRFLHLMFPLLLYLATRFLLQQGPSLSSLQVEVPEKSPGSHAFRAHILSKVESDVSSA